MNDTIWIQHRFTIEQNGLTLSDALVLPQAEYEALTPQEIETRKTERFTNWKAIIDNPPVQEEPTKEEQLASVEKELASLEEQKIVLELQKTELEKVSVKGGK